jgi:hypothetical protein
MNTKADLLWDDWWRIDKI